MSTPKEHRVGIGYALVDNYSFEQGLSAIIKHAVAGRPTACVITPNAQHVVLLGEDPAPRLRMALSAGQRGRSMWRRYLIGNAQFLSIVLHQRLRRAILSALVNMLKSSSFEAELHDATVRTEAHEIMLRFATAEQLN
jgi:UDP-N-acetyl-D-mannosaminuronic acid transferase (WecB/TagA/CpsF family)